MSPLNHTYPKFEQCKINQNSFFSKILPKIKFNLHK
jgi:hypothetical protein